MFHTVVAEKQGLSATETKALELLHRAGALTAGELGAQSGLAPPSITGLINRLEKKGYVRRVGDASDGRKVRIEPSAEKLGESASLFVDLVTQMEDLCSTFSVQELETIARFLSEAARRQHSAAGKLATRTAT
jgi:DNA-binding MarR family transcriptional regulator